MAAMIQVQKTKQVKYGLEVPNGLTYQGWEPGGEYTKPFILKNVNLKTQKVKYKISSDQFSSMIYPQPIVLSAGTSYTLPITFRPNAKCPYEEFIHIETGEGQFSVPIQARLPRAEISLPQSLKFGMTAVQGSLTVHFELSNICNVSANYSWDVPDGFSISPKTGSLPPKQSTKLKAVFSPTTAFVYSGEAVCKFNASKVGGPKCVVDERRVMHLEGVGKYPHVTVRRTTSTSKLPAHTLKKKKGSKLKGSHKSAQERLTVDDAFAGTEGGISEGGRDVTVEFGSVLVGTVAEKWIEVSNVSPVSLTFAIRPESNTDPHFIPLYTSSEFDGSLQPHESKKIKLLYSPCLPDPYPSIGYFSAQARGGIGSCRVVCSGSPVAPKVRIEERVVNFGNVELGKSTTRSLCVSNESNCGTTFQLLLGSGSVFECSSASGELGPNTSKSLTLHFAPTKPIPYCRHITLLLNHQDPLFVSFIGSCYSETVRPACVQACHVDAYLQHAKSGLSKLPPEQLKSYLEDGQLSLEGGVLTPTTLTPPTPGTPLTSHTSAYTHYLLSEHEPSALPHVSADVDVVRFGYCAPQRSSDGQMVSVTNHTEGVVTCVWITGAGSNTVSFAVTPEERQISPGSTACFTVTFSPDTASQFYSKEIECFVFYKGLADYRYIDPHTLTPPWCLTVCGTGHTFAPGTETFQPRLRIETKNLMFPASVPGQPVYRTAVLSNDGDTPILFDIPQDQENVFSVKPSHGLITDSQLVVLQLLPPESKVYKRILSCQLNATQLWNEELLLSGSGEAPLIKLDNKGELYFKPTCVEASSAVPYTITNTSRLPVKFRWTIDTEDDDIGVVRVEPGAGTILPNQSQEHTWYFTPTECSQYTLKAVLVSSIQTSALRESSGLQTKRKTVLSIHGLGTKGEITCSPATVDCGTVIIGTSSQHTLTINNPSPCSLAYRLLVDSSVTPPGSSLKQGIVELSCKEGVLPAWTQGRVRLTVRPTTTQLYTCTLKYHLIRAASSKNASQPLATADLCTLRVDGVYPSLEVVDIQGMGVANQHSKAALWAMLNIDNVNESLCDEPSDAELRYAIATRHNMQRKVSVRTRAIMDFDLGAAPLNAGTSVVHIMMENKGQVQTEWAFQFPSDMHLEPEYWADSGQLDDVEKLELNILDNDLFTIEPKRGSLEPGAVCTVVASFKHSHIGTSRLPVLLKINRGREILLNWTGVTVEPGRSNVHFSSHSHTLNPVSIGLQSYPRQVYTLYNVGESAVSYEIDTRPLDRLKQTNYSMTVLECLQPKGHIPRQSSVSVEFVFSPLEAKKYIVDLPIHLSSGDTVFVSFSGEGLDRSQECSRAAEVKAVQTVPVDGSISIAGQLAKLSQQTLRFGHVPLFSTVRRLVFLSNLSEHTLSYHWDLSSKLARYVVCIEPVTGYFQPGQSVACKVTFCSHSSPSFYDMDVLCQVIDETKMLAYHSELKEWERKEEERKHIFTITDTPSKTKIRPQSMPKLKSLSGAQTKKSTNINKTKRPLTSDNELRGKLSALPPIGAKEETYDEWNKRDLSVKSKTRPRARETSENEPPFRPESLILHLGVSAQTSSIPDFACLEGRLDQFFIDQQSLVSCDGHPPGLEESVRVGVEEKQVVECMLLQMIRGLLDDANFHTAIKNVVDEPVPYFDQFCTRDEPSDSVRHSASRHIYASGLASLPSGHDFPPHLTQIPHSHTSSQSSLSEDIRQVMATQSQCNDSLEMEETTAKQRSQDRSNAEMESILKRSPEFTNLVEGILENTILNILKEAGSGQMNITAPIYTIAKAPDTNP